MADTATLTAEELGPELDRHRVKLTAHCYRMLGSGFEADDENAYLESHSWDEYAAWHLALTDGATDETKARFAFVYGDFRRVHRSALIACQFRAAEWRHKDIELAAHELLQHLDATSA